MLDSEHYYSKRRFLFWQNFSRNLYELMQGFEADSAGKFVDDLDRSTIDGVNVFLHQAYIMSLRRYHSVLGEFISANEKGSEDF